MYVMSIKHNEALRKILQQKDKRGYLNRRESSTIEFKEKFSQANMPKYAKIMASFANNIGGYILFGIKDSPRQIIGINKYKFDNISTDKISEFLIEHLNPEIKWDIDTVLSDGKYIGYMYVYQSTNKPIICSVNAGKNEIKSGEIYFRYRGQSRKIYYAELKKIFDEFREKERQIWMSHIEKIAKIGPSNIALIDLLNGDIHFNKMGETKLIMDKALINDLKDKVKFIEEGKFSETGKEPTLKIIGEIQTANVVIPRLDPDKDYPYLQKHLAEKLQLRPYDIQILIWRYKIKNEKKYHIEIKTSNTGKVHKYSKYALIKLREILSNKKNQKNFLVKISKEFQSSRKKK